MSDCFGCVYLVHERDTGFTYCSCDDKRDSEEEALRDELLDNCDYYLSHEDAKADAKNRDNDHY